jgi:hypothetical protein
VPHLDLWDAQRALTEINALQKQPLKAIDSATNALASLGYVNEGGTLPRTSGILIAIKQWGLMEDCLIKFWMLLSHVYRLVALDLETQAEEYAKISYRICVGEGETFKETHSKLAE